MLSEYVGTKEDGVTEKFDMSGGMRRSVIYIHQARYPEVTLAACKRATAQALILHLGF